jgi:hypothetical protein
MGMTLSISEPTDTAISATLVRTFAGSARPTSRQLRFELFAAHGMRCRGGRRARRRKFRRAASEQLAFVTGENPDPPRITPACRPSAWEAEAESLSLYDLNLWPKRDLKYGEAQAQGS